MSLPRPFNFHRAYQSFGSWLRNRAAPGAVLMATLGGASPVLAQANAQEPEADDRDRAVTVIAENDTWGTSSDKWYTAGQRVLLDLDPDNPTIISPGFAALGFDNPDRSTVSLSQLIYTPEGITRDDYPDGSHPWAGFLGASAGVAQQRASGAVDSIEFTAGLTGPASYAEEAQRAVHDMFSGATPEGWHKQLKTEPHLNVTLGRHWPELGRLDLGSSDVRLTANPYVLGTAGTWERSATGGLLFSVGSGDDAVVARPDQAVPGRGVLGLNRSGDGSFGWSLYAGGEIRAVEWNTPISGNTWQSSPSADLEPVVGEAYAGLEVRYKGTEIRAEGVKRSKEFAAQPEDHRYLRLTVTRRF